MATREVHEKISRLELDKLRLRNELDLRTQESVSSEVQVRSLEEQLRMAKREQETLEAQTTTMLKGNNPKAKLHYLETKRQEAAEMGQANITLKADLKRSSKREEATKQKVSVWECKSQEFGRNLCRMLGVRTEAATLQGGDDVDTYFRQLTKVVSEQLAEVSTATGTSFNKD